jgi:hypothetical protein
MIETYKRAVKKLEMDECSVKVISRHAPGSNSIMKKRQTVEVSIV